MTDELAVTVPRSKRVSIRSNGSEEPKELELSANAARIAHQVDGIIRERDDAVDKLHAANARIEQFESTILRLESETIAERARTDAAKEQAEAGRIEVARLETVLKSMINAAHDALGEK